MDHDTIASLLPSPKDALPNKPNQTKESTKGAAQIHYKNENCSLKALAVLSWVSYSEKYDEE